MNAASSEIRRLTAGDVEAFRSLRLEALQREPFAFRATFADEARRPSAYFAERLTNGAVIGAFVDGALVGMAGIAPLPTADSPDCGVLWGVYVRQEMRGRGLAQAIIDAAMRAARGLYAEIRLRVKAGNTPARALYARLGFARISSEMAPAADGRIYEYEWWSRPTAGRYTPRP